MKENNGDVVAFMAKINKEHAKKAKQKEKEEVAPPTPLLAWVDKFSQLGEMRLQFNQSLVPELFYINDIDTNLLVFSITPGDSDGEDSSSSREKLDYTWEVKGVNYPEGYIDF